MDQGTVMDQGTDDLNGERNRGRAGRGRAEFRRDLPAKRGHGQESEIRSASALGPLIADLSP